MSIEVYYKQEKGNLLPTLSLEEYKCKCHSKYCTRTLVYSPTVSKFQLVRRIFGEPITVNSAFRCQFHNAEVGGLPNSYHTLGSALDLTVDTSAGLAALDRLEKIARDYFDVVIRYDNFIHCHMIVPEETTNEN